MYKSPPQFEDAISLLEKIKEHPQNLDQDVTEWYLSLAYIKSGKIELATIVLENITKSNHYKQKEATKILESLIEV